MSESPSQESAKVAGWGIALILSLMTLTLVFGVYDSYLKYVWGHATRPARLNDAIREEAMSAKMNNAWEGLKASELEVGGLSMRVTEFGKTYGEDRTKWPQGKREEYDQLAQQRFNAVQAYNRACANYNAVYKDEFRATAAPDDLPKTCAMMVP